MCPPPSNKITIILSRPSTAATSSSSNMTLPQQTQRKQQQRVSFHETCSVEFVEPLRTSLTPQERSAVWYTTADIETFRSEARYVCRQLRNKRHDFCSSDACVRGLELRRSGSRQKRKYMTIQCVLMAQRRMMLHSSTLTSTSSLGSFAANCSYWATQVAFVQGQRDFLLAYAADSVKDSPLSQYLPPLPAMTAFPVPFKTPQPKDNSGAGQKRSCRTEQDTPVDERCVRRRTSVC